MNRRQAEIVVIGAGMAGLAAARALAEAGRDVLVLEARERVGGRVYTVNDGPEAVELGAEFVHGKPPELWNLLHQVAADTQELDGSQLCWSEEGLRSCGGVLEHEFQWIEALKQWPHADCSFAEYLEQTQIPEASRRRLIDYIEGFNAADHRIISVASLGKQQAAEDAIEGDRLFHVLGGYHQIPAFLAHALQQAGGTLLLNTRVVAIEWARGSVQIQVDHAAELETIRASKTLVTLPLGVLQSGAVHFAPRPRTIFDAAATMRMGPVQRAVLAFREPFWRDGTNDPTGQLPTLSFLYATGRVPLVWWTPFPGKQNQLTAWIGGPRTDSLPRTPHERESYLLNELALVLDRDASTLRRLLVKTFTHDWQQDPFTLGAYSYVPVNALPASLVMAAPVDDTLYFAGEHTDVTGHWGTVHGALRSGLRAASQILAAE